MRTVAGVPAVLAALPLLFSSSFACTFPDPTYTDHPTSGGASGSGAGAAGASAQGGRATGGQCGSSCSPRTIAKGQDNVLAIAANSDSVQWVTALAADNTAELRTAPIGGGPVVPLTSEGIGWSAHLLRTDGSTAFLANQSPSGVVESVDLTLGTVNWTYQQENLDNLVLDAAMLFYSAPYGLVRLPKTGPSSGGRADLSPTQGPRLLAIDGNFLLVLSQADTRQPPRRVVRLRSDGSQAFADAEVLVSDAPDFDSACADATAYYFADADAGKILSLSRNATATPTTLVDGEAVPRNLQLHAQTLYWVTDSGKELRSVSASGGKASSLGKAVPGVLSAGPSGVFWATADGSILAL